MEKKLLKESAGGLTFLGLSYLQEFVISVVNSGIRQAVELSTLNENIGKYSDESCTYESILMIANIKGVLKTYIDVC